MEEENNIKTKLYLDTSIPSAYYDTSKPVRQLITQKWFENELLAYELFTSTIAIKEIKQFSNAEKREKIKELTVIYNMKILDLDNKAEILANEYIQKGAIPKSEPEDASHIAIATVNQIVALASWNFKHIVSLNPIRKIHEINKKHEYPIIEIGTLEMFGGAKYGSI